MKVLMVNGSSHEGCTFTALSEIGKILEKMELNGKYLMQAEIR